MKTNLNICAAAGLTVAFLLAGCGSTDGGGSSEIVIPLPNGFQHPADVPSPIERNKAEAGDPISQFNLALKHDAAGQSATAAEWYLKAADAGLAQAQFNYAWMLEKGIAGKQDTPLAALYYERAARQGLVEARYNFALMLAEGRGVLEDDQAAAQWMKRAADQGYADAQFQMGCLHKIGEGVPKDDAEAAKWFLRAAENLNEDAQYYAGLCFANGIGVEQDLVQAYKWLNLAAATSHAHAQRDKEVLTDLMIPEAVAEGQRLSVEFQAAQ
jgi:TPR repeat protein